MRDNSNFSRQGSNFRNGSKPRDNSRPNSNIRSGIKNGGNTRVQSKSQYRPKSEMFRKVETLEKQFQEFKKSQNEIKEILEKQIDYYSVCERGDSYRH